MRRRGDASRRRSKFRNRSPRPAHGPCRSIAATYPARRTYGGRARSTDQRFSVLFIDLDEFKKVNDSHGHIVGDRVLAEVANRLSRCVRSRDLLVRYGGDEFVVLIEQAAGWEEFEPVIARIHTALSDPIWVATEPLNISASVGGAELSEAHCKPEDILAAADRAMYVAKRRARSVPAAV